MGATAFNTAHNAAGRLGAVLVAMRETIDAFVGRQTPDDEPAGVDTPFQPLDAGIVSDAIPAFFVGRNRQGFWVAREAKERTGGVFLLESSALSFARTHSGPTGCATIFPVGRFELDLKNNGNPLVPHLGSLMRLAMKGRRRLTAIIGNKTAATQHQRERY